LDYSSRYQTWLQADISDQEIQLLQAMENDTEELKKCFGKELQFGTAGMRGVMGLGTDRLNVYTVRRAAQGMAAWLSETDLPKKAAIGYDSRHCSEEFARVCAVAFAEKGIQTYLYDRLAPTPMLSFAVRFLKCGCGIVISASHNSGEYNGVKCYGPDGCQMTDEPAAIVTEKISKIPYFVPQVRSFDEYMSDGLICYITSDVWYEYYQAVLNEALHPELIAEQSLKVVYTPLCGTGNEPVRHILGKLGAQIHVVGCQESPDGDFKTCEYPNPETDLALAESYKIADKWPCDLILGTDPDCDRVAIAVPWENGYKKLTGNELGCLLLEYIIKAMSDKQTLPADAVAVRSIVSIPLADKICGRYGVQMRAVLTGFKYIGGEILALEEKNQENRFVFGFEESCGYLKGTYARDKDAVVASMLVCEMAAYYKKLGKTLIQALQELYKTYGYYISAVKSVELSGADAMEKAAKVLADLRLNPPTRIAGEKVTFIRDYSVRFQKNLMDNTEQPIDLPKSNVLEFILGEKGSMIVRPSGTEPKIKFYFTAVGETETAAQNILEDMKKEF